MKCYVNPMKTYVNNPYPIIELPTFQLPPNRIYQVTEACYWWQDIESGWTDFFFHTPIQNCTKLKDNHHQTPTSEGYGGRVFTIQVQGYGTVDLRGPWSGGCYGANQYLPKPAIEVTVKKGRFNHIGTNITWEKLKTLLPEGWTVIDSREYNKHWPELTYKGQRKKDWSKETTDYLDELYKKQDKESSSYIQEFRPD